MARLLGLLTYFHMTLAMVLMTIAALAVPVQEARADLGDYCCGSSDVPTCCYNWAMTECVGDPNYATCMTTKQADCENNCSIVKSCSAVSGMRRCDDGCYYDPVEPSKCSKTVKGSSTGCVIGDNTCALCICQFADAKKEDCWCKK
jgi:hypothetical protein